MLSWFEQFRANAVFVAKPGATLGVGLWSLRYRFDLDKPLDRRTKALRWAVVLLCWFLAALPRVNIGFGILSVLGMVVGLAFLNWPNLALRLARWIKKAEFQYVESALRRWNPTGVDDASAQLDIYDSYVTRVLDALEAGATTEVVQKRLSAIRAEWTESEDVDGDRKTAHDLVSWWLRRTAHDVA